MAQVKWRPKALDDLERLHTFLRNKDVGAASKAARTILLGVTLLETSPRIGRPMSDGTDRRELFIPFGGGAYVLRYILATDDVVVMIRVWHNREERLKSGL